MNKRLKKKLAKIGKVKPEPQYIPPPKLPTHTCFNPPQFVLGDCPGCMYDKDCGYHSKFHYRRMAQ